MGQVMKIHEYATETDARISATVMALISGRQADARTVGQYIGTTKASLYRKLNGASSWKASEIEGLAQYFQVRVGDLYDGLGGRFGPAPTAVDGVGPAGLEPATYGLQGCGSVSNVIDLNSRRPLPIAESA